VTRAVHPRASLNQVAWVLLRRPGLLAESAWRPRSLGGLGRTKSPTAAWRRPVCGTVDGQQRCGNVDGLGERSRATRPAAATKIRYPLANPLRWGTVWHAGTKVPPELGRPRPPDSTNPPQRRPSPRGAAKRSMFYNRAYKLICNDSATLRRAAEPPLCANQTNPAA
jgi:hypothetical protein